MRAAAVQLIFVLSTLALGAGYFSIGYQDVGAIEFGGGGYSKTDRFLFGGEGFGSPAGYGYGLGYLAYEIYKDDPASIYLRFGLGGKSGNARGESGFLAELGLLGLVHLPGEHPAIPSLGWLAGFQVSSQHSGFVLKGFVVMGGKHG